jgi:nucleoside-diphosphate-sugar epimerase
MTRTIAMTGAGGFVGSALAASILSQDEPCVLVSLAPDDLDGSLVRAAVGNALRGFGCALDRLAMIQPIAVDLDDGTAMERTLNRLAVEEFWHVAAHMSYDRDQLAQAFNVNAVASTRLMRATGAIGHFYFISTTGVAGPGDREEQGLVVPERLLEQFAAVNPYTASKIMAEYMLCNVSAQTAVPLTILRLGAVIGHSRSGWANDTRYGYYSYLQAFKRFLGREPAFFVDIDPERRFPVIHIDHLAEVCRRLRRRAPPGEPAIFHVCNRDLLTVREHFQLFEAVTGGRLRIHFGAGEKAFNRVFNRMNADNNRFMGTRHQFDTRRSIEAVGEDAIPALTENGVATVIKAYVDDSAQEPYPR